MYTNSHKYFPLKTVLLVAISAARHAGLDLPRGRLCGLGGQQRGWVLGSHRPLLFCEVRALPASGCGGTVASVRRLSTHLAPSSCHARIAPGFARTWPRPDATLASPRALQTSRLPSSAV